MNYTITLEVFDGAELDILLAALNDSDLGGRVVDTVTIKAKA